MLAAPVGRAVGHQQDFGAGLGEALDDLLAPDVLADRHAKPHAAKRNGPRQGTGREHALFIEHAIVGQIDLEAHGLDAPMVEQGDGVVAAAVLDPWRADEQGRAAVSRLARERLQRRAAGFLKGRLQHEILGRIARQKQFAEQDEIGAERGRLRAGGADRAGVAFDIADDAVDLRERDDETVGGRGRSVHGEGLARRYFNGKRATRSIELVGVHHQHAILAA